MTLKNENAHRPGRAPSTASNAGRTLPLGTDANKASTAAAWPEPLPLPQARAVVPALTPDLLPPALRPWLADLSERMQVPLEFPTIAALVSLSSLVGRKLAIRPKRFDDWSEVGNLWGLVVGWPGILKTPAMEPAMAPLHQLEAEAGDTYARDHAHDEAEEAVRRARIKGIEARIASQVEDDPSVDVTSLRDALCKLKARGEPMRRYITQDPTIERLGVLLAENPNGILLYRDEIMGWLQRMEREGHESDRAFYLELWTGRGISSSDRIGRGLVSHPRCLSIVGSIQPGPFADYVRSAGRSGRGDDGLVQRFQLAVWPELSESYTPIDRAPDRAARERACALFRQVDALRPADLAQEQEDGMHYLRFDEPAQQVFLLWLTSLEVRIRSKSSGLSAVMLAHLGKYRGLCARLAMLFHVIDCADGGLAGPVRQESARLAVRWCEFLESHARRIYGEATHDCADAVQELSQRIVSGQLPAAGFTARDVYRKGWRGLKTPEGISGALDELVRLHWLRAEHRPTGGRGTIEYRINPRVFASPTASTAKTDRSPDAGRDATEPAR